MSTSPDSEHTDDLAQKATRYASGVGTVAERGIDAVQAGAQQARDSTVRAAKYIKGRAMGSRVIVGVFAAALITAVGFAVRRSRNRVG